MTQTRDGEAVRDDVETFLFDVREQLWYAKAMYAPMNSAHEAYGVIMEEVGEFWDEVRKKPADRDAEAMYDELVQVAAMAMRAAIDVALSGTLKTR